MIDKLLIEQVSYMGQTEQNSVEDWVIVLGIFYMWDFTKGQASVLKKLQSIADPITKIQLYHKYTLSPDEWLIPAIQVLARRFEPLREEEGERLGISDTTQIARIRECFHCCCDVRTMLYPRAIVNCPKRAVTDFTAAIRNQYKLVGS